MKAIFKAKPINCSYYNTNRLEIKNIIGSGLLFYT